MTHQAALSQSKKTAAFPAFPVPETMGGFIQALREDLGFTQAELARLAWVSQSTVSDLESGRQLRPHARTLDRLERVLGLESGTLKALLDDDEAERQRRADESKHKVAIPTGCPYAPSVDRSLNAKLRAAITAEEKAMRDFVRERDRANAAEARIEALRRSGNWGAAAMGAAAMLLTIGLMALAALS